VNYVSAHPKKQYLNLEAAQTVQETSVSLESMSDPKHAVSFQKPKIDYKKALVDIYKDEFIEFTLSVGCPVQCKRYCPQEVFMKNYGKNARIMSFDVFKQILSHIPTNVTLSFAGFCEPFVNPDFIRMLEHAYYSGYKLLVFTTLYGAKPSDVERLLQLDYYDFCLHLRDGHVVSFPLTPEYEHNVFRVIEGIPNVRFVLMNELFQTNNRENVTRGNLPEHKRVGFCQKLATPQFVILPNGAVQLCCYDFGLKHIVGNLLKEDYAIIRARFKAKKGYYALCPYCSLMEPYKEVLYKKMTAGAKKVARKII
jgi:hypothetical protein